MLQNKSKSLVFLSIFMWFTIRAIIIPPIDGYKSNIHTTIWFLPLYIWQRQFTIRAIFIPPFDAMSRSTHYVTQPNNSLYELNKINKKRKDNKSCQHQFARTVRHDNYWLIAMKWEVSSNVSKLKMRYMYDHMTLH